jgi:energy-coupling factor transport system substrate-specific component
MEQYTHYQYRRKRIRAREIVLLALLTAIVVLASILCAITVPVHLGTALVVIIGATLGWKTGGIIGAMSMLLNNFYLGQGIWTPFQMLAMGLIGVISGLCFSKGHGWNRNISSRLDGRKRRIVLSIFTIIVVVIVYGGIMNFQTFLYSAWMMGTMDGVSGSSLLAFYITGIPYDISHGVAAAICVFLLEPPFAKKMERIYLKYGFYR